MNNKLGDKDTSERLISELYIELRRRVNEWAAVTMQTAQARMGYVGQHLVSVVTGYPGGRSGARGYDLILPTGYGEIKTCYRVDQLGKCIDCSAVVASIESECPACDSTNIRRNDDSKWLISIKSPEELQLTLDPVVYYLVLFDFTDLNDPHTIRASIYEVDPKAPGFALAMVDYFYNIRANSNSQAPFNLWPFQLKFDLMRPKLIYRSLIHKDDSIETIIFPGENEPELASEIDLLKYRRGRVLEKDALQAFAARLNLELDSTKSKVQMLTELQDSLSESSFSQEDVCDALAKAIYQPKVSKNFETMLRALRVRLEDSNFLE